MLVWLLPWQHLASLALLLDGLGREQQLNRRPTFPLLCCCHLNCWCTDHANLTRLPLPCLLWTCSNVAYDAAARRLSFSSVHIGCLALLQDTSAHLPYSSWTIRPSGGLGGSTAVIDLQVSTLRQVDRYHSHSYSNCCALGNRPK